jgi:hypothetical protein
MDKFLELQSRLPFSLKLRGFIPSERPLPTPSGFVAVQNGFINNYGYYIGFSERISHYNEKVIITDFYDINYNRGIALLKTLHDSLVNYSFEFFLFEKQWSDGSPFTQSDILLLKNLFLELSNPEYKLTKGLLGLARYVISDDESRFRDLDGEMLSKAREALVVKRKPPKQETPSKFRDHEGGGYINEAGYIFRPGGRTCGDYNHPSGKFIAVYYADVLTDYSNSTSNSNDLMVIDYLWSDGSRFTNEDKKLFEQHIDEINLGWGGNFRVC